MGAISAPEGKCVCVRPSKPYTASSSIYCSKTVIAGQLSRCPLMETASKITVSNITAAVQPQISVM